MSLLAHLRRQGLRVASDGNRLLVDPRTALNEAIKTTIRINKGALLRELATEAEAYRGAIRAAAEQAGLGPYRAALILGGLHLCGNCASFQFGADPAGAGVCSRFREDLVPFAAPFWCSGFTPSRTPVAPEFLPDPDALASLETKSA